MRQKTGIACVVSDASTFIEKLTQRHRIVFDTLRDRASDTTQYHTDRLVLLDGSHSPQSPLLSRYLLELGLYEVFLKRLPYLLLLPVGFHFTLSKPTEPFSADLTDRINCDQVNWILHRTAYWHGVDSMDDLGLISAQCRTLIVQDPDEGEMFSDPNERIGVAEEVLRDTSQREAILSDDGPTRIAAPPGSGKTRVITSRIRVLLNRGISPRSILVMAFNERARSELIERLAEMSIDVARTLSDRGVSVHTFNSFGHQILTHDLGLHFEDPSSAIWDHILELILGRTASSEYRFAYRTGLSRVRRDLIDPAMISIDVKDSQTVVSFEEFYRRHLEQQLDQRIFGYDDQIFLSVRTFLSDPQLRNRIQDRFTHVLIDELQDLNAAQMLLTDIVSRPQWNIFAVGDDDQMIYGWRGANTQVMLGFPDRFPTTRSLTLGTNYRSGMMIIRCANRLIDHNMLRMPKVIRPRPSAPAGAVTLLPGVTAWDQAIRIMDRILNESLEKLEHGRIAILSRFNARIPMIQTACLKAGIRFYPLKFGVFQTMFARRLRDDLHNGIESGHVSWPTGLLAHWDPLTSMKMVNGETTELGDTDESDNPVDAHPSIIANLVYELALMTDSPDAFFSIFDILTEREGIARDEREEAPVRIATIHSVKGREFQDVYLFNAAETAIEQELLEEERRVFYVAVTRAIHRLYVSYPIGNASRFLKEMLTPKDRLSWQIDQWAEESSRLHRESSILEARLQTMKRLHQQIEAYLDDDTRTNVCDYLQNLIQRIKSSQIAWCAERERTSQFDRRFHDATTQQCALLKRSLIKLKRRLMRLESWIDENQRAHQLLDRLELCCSELESKIEQLETDRFDLETCRCFAYR